MAAKGESQPSQPSASEFECSICWSLLHRPVVGPCGHEFCELCYSRVLKAEDSPRCPLCRKPLSHRVPGVCTRLQATIKQLFPDAAAQRQQEVEEPETRFLPFGAEAGPISPEEYGNRMRRLQSGDWRRHVRPQQQSPQHAQQTQDLDPQQRSPQQAQQPQQWTEQQRELLRRVHAGHEELSREMQALNAEVRACAADVRSRAQGWLSQVPARPQPPSHHGSSHVVHHQGGIAGSPAQGGQFHGGFVGGSNFGGSPAGGIAGGVAVGPPAQHGNAPWLWPSAPLASDQQASSQQQAGAAVGGIVGGSGSLRVSSSGPTWLQAPPIGSCVFTMGFSPPGAGARRLGAAGRPRPGGAGGNGSCGGGGSCRQRFRMRTAPGRGPLRLPA